MQLVQNWYDTCDETSYPIDERADTGIPHDIISDISLRWPAQLGDTAYISSVIVTDALLSIVLQTESALLGSVTVTQPVEPFAPLTISPAVDGVGGFLIPGSGAPLRRVRVASGTNAPIIPRCARPYSCPAVNGFTLDSKIGTVKTQLEILAGDGIEVLAATAVPEDPTVSQDYVAQPRIQRKLNGAYADSIVVRMAATKDNYAAVVEAAGACGGTASAGCAHRIRKINSVEPDDNGNIDIEVVGAVPVTLVGELPGLALEMVYGLTALCNRDPLRRLLDTADLCEGSTDPSSEVPSSSVVPSSSSSLIPEDPDCLIPVAPWLQLFSTDTDLYCFTRAADWAVIDCMVELSAAAGAWNNCVRTGLNIRGSSLATYVRPVDGYAGLCFSVAADSLSFAVLDAAGQCLRIGKKSGTTTLEYLRIPTTVTAGAWYRLEIKTLSASLAPTVQVFLNGVLMATLNKFPVPNGGSGFATRSATAATFDALLLGSDLELTEHGCASSEAGV